MDPNSQIYFNSALKLSLPVLECPPLAGFELRLGGNNYYFFNKITPINSASSSLMACDKSASNAILNTANIPVPKSRRIEAQDFTYDRLISVTSELKFPVVLKPTWFTAKGQDVICNIKNLTSLHMQCEKLLKIYPLLTIEEFHADLKDYRILVFKNKILDVVERYPAEVFGNGENTIEELVAIENTKRLKLSDILLPITFDYEAEQRLLAQQMVKESIPEKGKRIILGYTCNTSRGGTVKAGSGKMCKENKKLFLKVARVLNLELAGIDVACKDLMEPLTNNRGIIIEANPYPSIRIHEDGLGGEKRAVTKTIMRSFIFKHPVSYLFNLLKF